MTVRDLPGEEPTCPGPEIDEDPSPPPADHGLEIELKLAGEADALEALWKTAIAPKVKAVGHRLISTYFDTSDFRLQRRGMTLRVRQDGDDFTQTVKVETGPLRSVMRRGEWSSPIDGPTPDLRTITDPKLLDGIGLILTGDLNPVFTTDVSRQIKKYRVYRGGVEVAYIEAALDIGTIHCKRAREPISEIELELLGGSSIALQKEALRLHRIAPFQYQPLSKSDRGRALAYGTRPQGVKSAPVKLTPNVSTEEGLELVIANCVGHWLANHAAVLDGSDTEGVHQMRVALRRMRSALTIFKGTLSTDDLNWLQREAKHLIGGLGPARDWDVFIDELLQPVINGRPEDDNLKILHNGVCEERRLAYEHARSILCAPSYLSFVLELGIWLEDRERRRKRTLTSPENRLMGYAQKELDKRHKKVMKLGRNLDYLSDEALHCLRISLKKLRYATEFFVALFEDPKTKPYLKTMRQLQDDFGHLNDVAVAEGRLGDLCDKSESDDADALQTAFGVVIGWHSHAFERVRHRISGDWLDFTNAKPFWRQDAAARGSQK